MASKRQKKPTASTTPSTNLNTSTITTRLTTSQQQQKEENNQKNRKSHAQVIEKPKLNTDKKPQVKKESKQKKINKCSICLKVFKGLNDLRKHLRIHSDERPYQCPEAGCGKRFRQAGCLKNHRASQHGTDIIFYCDLCGKQFPVKERLRLHLRVHTGYKPYKCNVCQKTFARGGQLSQHMVTHTGVKKYKCDYCDSKFSCLANLKIHLKSHLEERDFICHICSKAFYRRDALKKHISCYHENIKAFHCNICNKMFKGHLPQHQRTHQAIKTHGCLTCGALFSQRSQLIVHQRIHSGERPYRCQICHQAFAHSSVLKLHIRKHTGEKPFKCPIDVCAKSQVAFSQLPHLKKHMLSIHGQNKPYMCTCETFFKTKQDLQQHSQNCKNSTNSMEDDENTRYTEPVMPIAKMRLMITILIKKISSESKLKELGFEKRLIDNILVDSLRCAGRSVITDETFTESERLKLNIEEFLDWTLPSNTMKSFKDDRKSVEEILEQLVEGLS